MVLIVLLIVAEPDAKRCAAMTDPFGAQLAAMKGVGGGSLAAGMGIKTGLGISGSGKACTEEIRIPDPLVGLSKYNVSSILFQFIF